MDAIEHDLCKAIFGQERAIRSVIRALNRARFRFAVGADQRPLVNLLFLGPTGVGKSECAKRLAHRLHPDGGGFLKIDCSLFHDGHEVSALVGAPPSFVGREQLPLLNPDIIEQQQSVVLFDEIEKGSTALWNLLLQIMEDGTVTLLNSGRIVSFRNTILIMTTNVGAREMLQHLDQRHIGFHSPRAQPDTTSKHIYQIGWEALQRKFQPEWLNRIDEIVAFHPLTEATLSDIFDRMIDEANLQYRAHGISVEISAAAKQHLLRKGHNPGFGARPLRAQLLKHIDAPLADLLASGGIRSGDRLLAAYT